MLRFFGWLFTAFTVLFLGTLGAGAYYVWLETRDLPDYTQLDKYEPAVMTRIHAGDGSLLAEYAKERRIFVPINAIPPQLIHAFISAEDKNFYQHSGLDWQGLARAVVMNAKAVFTGGHMIGASTITQQVAKNFLLTNERKLSRKVKEAVLSMRIEERFGKDRILELYLNEIYLGMGSYGVAAASLNYFGKPLNELTVEQMAYLAALPKAPNNLNPYKNAEYAVDRRNYVLGEMADNGYLTKEEAQKLKQLPLGISLRPFGTKMFSAEFFSEEVRREVAQIYGDDQLYTGGLSIRTTLDPKMQAAARQALTRGLLKFDRARGFRGPITQIDLSAGDWGPALGKLPLANDLLPWSQAVVLEVSDKQAKIGLKPALLPNGKFAPERETGVIPLELMKWARKVLPKGGLAPAVKKVSDTLAPGDVVYVAPSDQAKNTYHLVQMPEIQGALVAMDPHTGRVLSLVGGFSYGSSQFNRAVQAVRQPGSSFKPVVYAAALDNGYTPASVVLDAPVEVQNQDGSIWKPENYSKDFYGPSTLRRGIELSRNAMTVRLAQDMGMEKVASLAERLGIYDKMPPLLAYSLGAGETTLIRMVAAYSMIDNGGKRIQPTLIDRIQDRYGKTVFRHDERPCEGCKAEEWSEQEEPEIPDTREDVMNPFTAYQITSMMEGVVQRGTGQALRSVGKPVAGKTGTSNDEKDAWFVGFTPDLAVGVYIGYDTPRPMGRKQTGGELAAPVVADFLKVALKDKPATPFRVPAGIELIPIDPATGMRAEFGGEGVILEAFKPGEAPNDEMSVIGGPVPDPGSTLDEGGLTSGTGGLY